MSARLTLDSKTFLDAVQAMYGLGAATRRSGLEPSLLRLVKTRASQINGCGFCIDMHTKDARHRGETEQRLHLLAAWREASVYSERERAALAWTEAVTRLEHQEVSDEVFDLARSRFTEEELVALTLCIVEINGWNRLSIAFRQPAGNYRPGSLPLAGQAQSKTG